MKEINRYIDHTLLKPNATKQQILDLCQEARNYNFATVCLNPTWVELAAKELKGSNTGICTVIGFPLGAGLAKVKAFEASEAIKQGATEIDMVLNIGALIDGNTTLAEEDISAVVKASGETPVKVIFETCLLTDDQIKTACELSEKAGAKFVKTSTGFSDGGATLEHVQLMKNSISKSVLVKASGGIRDLETAIAMVEAGASRLGTSSGVKIMNGEKGSGY
ncbi:deoxyribose-phosphate aldolase [Halobacteriovorax sp. JY17]|uniref:deoxyribose-phosphate aldolase n=1 Tax=Halobacteriovorax sp. JY17 TaxID=2014617 RepID=UPI000C467977|nr:deoxyribose-phosphate aldolase [Halobacteriovorax sp. JY17]PIK15995.1 MAG: deoxyribose-phosphate aldolase [Halobacteriovorax sp. JY17]